MQQLETLRKRWPSFDGTPMQVASSFLRRHGAVLVKASAKKISVETAIAEYRQQFGDY